MIVVFILSGLLARGVYRAMVRFSLSEIAIESIRTHRQGVHARRTRIQVLPLALSIATRDSVALGALTNAESTGG
jgi:hypothetical protein